MAEKPDLILPLFAYGTLMFPTVLESIIGRVPECIPATIQGYRRLEVAGESFPGLTQEDGARVEGLLYLDIGPDEWKRLTAFEDDFYVLEEVIVFCRHMMMRSLAYVVPPARRSVLSEKAWDPEYFRKNHLVQFSRPRTPGNAAENQESTKI